jgi:hypothetical protein
MHKSQNRSMGTRAREGNIILQKANNHTIEDLVYSEGDESSFAEVRRMRTRMLKEL